MKRNTIAIVVATVITATFVGGAVVGNHARQTTNAYADSVKASSETETETVPCALNPDGTLPTETEGTLPDESDSEIPEIESDETEIEELDVDSYLNSVSDSDAVEIVPSNQLTTEELENRNGKIIVEKMVGVVDDDEGNGHILNPYVEGYNYIMYGGHCDCHKGDVVVTYNVYNPNDNAIDDVVARTDYVVGNVNQ